jgi:isopentenyl diphosphate isomerase/L-lactate dehydrogenase-like FMN-dependent dehydrogenase
MTQCRCREENFDINFFPLVEIMNQTKQKDDFYHSYREPVFKSDSFVFSTTKKHHTMQDVEKKVLAEIPRALVNLEDYHQRAKGKLLPMVYDYYSGGSDDQFTLVDNEQAFRRIKLRPKILIDVSSHTVENSVSCQTQVLNSTATISFPCIIAPTALHRMANSEHGELATVRAAVACSTIMCVSSVASVRMEQIAEEYREQIKKNYPQSTSQLWYQLYIFTDRQYLQWLIERAEKCGFKALVITVDRSELGNKESDVRNKFSFPNGIRAENLIDDDSSDVAKNSRRPPVDAALSWNDLEWIRSITSLPLIIKGIIHPDDAREAVRHGVQGIMVSNHGGRQLDTCQNTIDALPDIVEAVRGSNHQIDVYVDGGVRRGTDILKAIALGAKAVLVGRPILWGIAVDGAQGAQNVLNILKKEFRLAMMLCGCQTVDDIRKNNLLVTTNNINQSKL